MFKCLTHFVYLYFNAQCTSILYQFHVELCISIHFLSMSSIPIFSIIKPLILMYFHCIDNFITSKFSFISLETETLIDNVLRFIHIERICVVVEAAVEVLVEVKVVTVCRVLESPHSQARCFLAVRWNPVPTNQ